MLKFYQKPEFINGFKKLIKECDKIILDIYNKDFKVEYKDDKSPLTIADQLSNKHICEYLTQLNKSLEDELKEKLLIISEENKNAEYEYRKLHNWCWLVDPIDGTKEFVKKNGQFTVNIGLTYKNNPIFGIVSIPTKDEIYYGVEGLGSFKISQNKEEKLIINKNKMEKEIINIVASSSHMNDETKEFVKKYENHQIINIGSSIKLLYIAENKADIYPRLGPTSEWDTCAAHAVVKYAGGNVYKYDSKEQLDYNKDCLLNPYFIVK